METKKYTKKPITIDAIQLTENNILDVVQFMGVPVDNYSSSIEIDKWDQYVESVCKNGGMTISTLEGNMFANFGDFVIKSIMGEFYPCKEEIFWETYDLLEDIVNEQ